ncbi:MAG: tRNA modification GTPase TrmE [Anaerocolumna sp.]|jgi:tRNA modification GTPase|nr:tRNA modification GTPase TrmE [Anaerocolumna sp.]
MNTDTIAAVATAVSNAGISIIRISGEDSFNIIDKIYKSKKGNKLLSKVPSHTVHYGYIMDNETIIDEVMVVVMRAPNTYTKEDVIEIDCHGGIVVTKRVLETVLKYGAITALPGEFTKRAFLNGRIDLSGAEAVSDIINAKSEMAVKNSLNQLNGNIFVRINKVRDSIIHDIAFIEAALDDPEHISLEDFKDKLYDNIIENIEILDKLIKSSSSGRMLREGIKTVILGKPNAGKSSLMNTLTGVERAIVTDIPGTTRDTLEESIQIGSISLNIIDTAGIRNTEDVVEQIGVDRAKKTAEEADLIIYVVDSSVVLDENDYDIVNMIKDKNGVVLLNKSDLLSVVSNQEIINLTGKEVFSISAKENVGIEQLEEWIISKFFGGKIAFNDEVFITNIRQKEALIGCRKSLMMVKQSIEDNMPEDFYAIDMMSAYSLLGSIIGEEVDEDLINTIFREFCMGK